MSHTASFQPLCQCHQQVGVLRVHPIEGDWEHRDKYKWCSTMIDKKPLFELWGVDKWPPLSHLRAIRDFALSNGYREVAFERHGKWIVWDVVTGRRTTTGK
jgi:hypothetical protein